MQPETSLPDLDLGCLQQTIFSLLKARAFPTARALIENLMAMGKRSPTLLLGYAICLIEMGEGESAVLLMSQLREGMGKGLAHQQPRFWAAFAAVEEMLPGNRWDPVRLERLQGEAERMRPTLAKRHSDVSSTLQQWGPGVSCQAVNGRST